LAGEIGDWLCPVAPIQRCSGGRDPGAGWTCDRLSPLEEIASVPAILKAVGAAVEKDPRIVLAGKKGPITLEKVAHAARRGDPLVGQVLEGVAQTLGWVVCQMDSLFNPEKIILAGPLVMLGDSLLGPVRKAVGRFCSELHQEPPLVVDSELGSFNGALGAAALALHEWEPKR